MKNIATVQKGLANSGKVVLTDLVNNYEGPRVSIINNTAMRIFGTLIDGVRFLPMTYSPTDEDLKERCMCGIDSSMGDVLDFTDEQFEEFCKEGGNEVDPIKKFCYNYRKKMLEALDDIFSE